MVGDLFSPKGGSENATPLRYTDIFKECLPYYLHIGMSYDDYWNGPADLCRYYRKAHELKRKEDNEKLWLQGLYIYEAILDASPILRSFAKKGTKPIPFSKEPYPLSAAEIKEREERKAKAQMEELKRITLEWSMRVNQKRKDGKGEDSIGE